MIYLCMNIVEGAIKAIEKVHQVLSSHLKPQIQEWFEDKSCVFQHDSAPCHTAKKVQDWIKKNHLKLLPWRGNSPDKNPIVIMWDVLKGDIHKVPITNKIQLMKRLIRVCWFHFKTSRPCVYQ